MIIIDAASNPDFDYSKIGDIYQNVKTIITTPAGSVPFDREFGVRQDFLDAPISHARSLVASEYISKIRRYEPRVKRVKIKFSSGGDGALVSEVRIIHVAD